MVNKIIWSAARLTFYFFILISILSAGLIVFPLGPIYSWYTYRDLRFWKYRHLVFPAVYISYKVMIDWIKNPEYRSYFMVPLSSPPMKIPNMEKTKIRRDWQGKDDTCTGCIKCCVQRKCPLIDPVKKTCIAYDSFFWRYFTCGRYPGNSFQIKYYGCTKWEII